MKALGLVAAAGRSLRMGSTKALLLVDGEPFAARLARVFLDAGLAPVVVTLPTEEREAERVRAVLPNGVVARENAHDALGFFGSVLTVIEETEDLDDETILVVTPVDAPFATAELVRALVSAVDDAHDAAVPVVEGARGHPIAVRRRTLSSHAAIGRTHGLAGVFAQAGVRLREVAWSDARVCTSVNTPDEYARLWASSGST